MNWFRRSPEAPTYNEAERILVDRVDWQNMRHICAAIEVMMQHPEARALVLRARKLASPNVFVPEIDGAPWGFGPPTGPAGP